MYTLDPPGTWEVPVSPPKIGTYWSRPLLNAPGLSPQLLDRGWERTFERGGTAKREQRVRRDGSWEFGASHSTAEGGELTPSGPSEGKGMLVY
jgi:hypothetical protein